MYSLCKKVYTLLKVVGYDLSVLSMPVMGFQTKVFLDFLNFLNFTQRFFNTEITTANIFFRKYSRI